jgi:hypothetical protein
MVTALLNPRMTSGASGAGVPAQRWRQREEAGPERREGFVSFVGFIERSRSIISQLDSPAISNRFLQAPGTVSARSGQLSLANYAARTLPKLASGTLTAP